MKHDHPYAERAGIDIGELAAVLAPEIAAMVIEQLSGRLKAVLALGDDAVLGARAAGEALGKSLSTMEAWRARGIGPKWIKLGPRAVGYRVRDLRRYINEVAG
jgi:hypothetical protein